jgi:hypothetical protein
VNYYLTPAFLWLVRKLKELIGGSRGEVMLMVRWDGARFYVWQASPKGRSEDDTEN